MKSTLKAIRDLYLLLPHLFRLKLIMTGVISFLLIIVDIIGIGILIPLLLMILSEDKVLINPYLSYIYHHGGFISLNTFVIFVLIVVVAIALFRLIASSYLQYKQSRILFDISQHLSLQLYQLYYNKGFLFVKNNNSHRLINKVEGVAGYLIQGYFIPFTSLLCELVVTALILVALVVYNYQVFGLVIITMVPITLIYYRLTQKRIKQYGEKLFNLYPQKSQLLQQTFVGYPDMALSGMFSESVKQYDSILKEQGILIAKKGMLQASLKRVLEFTVICSVVILVALAQFMNIPTLGIVVGVFALAIYRVMPGMVKTTNSVFAMRSNSFALSLLEEMRTEQKEKEITTPQEPINFDNNIELDKVIFGYEEEKAVINKASLTIPKGEFLGVKGESGSGKSTLFYLLLGLVEPWQGEIRIDGVKLNESNRQAWREKIGYVSQQLFMINGSLLDNIVMGTTVDMNRVQQVLELASLSQFVSTLDKGVDTFIGEGGCLLSGGQRQRLGIARALYRNVEILMLDEATSSLDEEMQKTINETLLHLKSQHTSLTIIVISHHSEALSICDKVVNIYEIQ